MLLTTRCGVASAVRGCAGDPLGSSSEAASSVGSRSDLESDFSAGMSGADGEEEEDDDVVTSAVEEFLRQEEEAAAGGGGGRLSNPVAPLRRGDYRILVRVVEASSPAPSRRCTLRPPRSHTHSPSPPSTAAAQHRSHTQSRPRQHALLITAKLRPPTVV